MVHLEKQICKIKINRLRSLSTALIGSVQQEESNINEGKSPLTALSGDGYNTTSLSIYNKPRDLQVKQ